MSLIVLIVAALAVYASGVAGWYYAFGSAIGRIQPSWRRYPSSTELSFTDKQEKDIGTLRSWSCWAAAWPILIPLGIVASIVWGIAAGPYFGCRKLYNSSQERSKALAIRQIEAAQKKKDEEDVLAEAQRKSRQKVAA